MSPVEPGLEPYLDHLLADPSPDQLAGVGAPFEPGAAVAFADKDRLLDPAPLAVESGWCRMPDGVGYVAMRTAMPDVTPEMVDWWFDWHPRRGERYRAWHPTAHFDNSLDPPAAEGAKPYWGATHHAVEDFGDGRVDARIEFLDPAEFGFSLAAVAGDAVGTIVCARVGDRISRHTLMAHVYLREGDGLVLRSNFWLGGEVGLRLPDRLGPVNGLLRPALNSKFLRHRLLKDSTIKALAIHCAEEYTNLAVILPPLYERFGEGTNDE